jgi:hypothetical protein
MLPSIVKLPIAEIDEPWNKGHCGLEIPAIVKFPSDLVLYQYKIKNSFKNKENVIILRVCWQCVRGVTIEILVFNSILSRKPLDLSRNAFMQCVFYFFTLFVLNTSPSVKCLVYYI